MNTNTERPKLKLNFGANILTLNTNGGALVAGSTLRKVVVFEKPITQDTPKAKSDTLKKSKNKRLLQATNRR